MSSRAWGTVTGRTGDTGQWPKLGLAASRAAAHTGEELGIAAQKGRRKIGDASRKKRARMKAEVEAAAAVATRDVDSVSVRVLGSGTKTCCIIH